MKRVLARIDTDCKYYPFPEPKHWSISVYEFDQIKLNLLWLVCPEVDKVHDKSWECNFIANDINELCDKSTREFMQLPPMEAVELFIKHDHDLLMTQGWPVGYHSVMRKRAKEAAFRIQHGGGHNVVFIDFTKGKRSA